MEMVEILKGRLPDGLEIVKVKDRSNRSQAEIVFRYQGVEVNSWLPKMCTPGHEERVCDLTVYNAILQVAIRNNDVKLAQKCSIRFRMTEVNTMVDCYGRWTWDPSLPKVKWCDCDRIAQWIIDSGYKVKTTIENLVHMILLHFDSPDNYEEYGEEFTVDGCKQYVEDSGGLREFDYYL